MHTRPTGTVTFLFTDIQGSTQLWEQNPDAMRPALARHDQLLRSAIVENGGHVFKTVGDAFCAAFPSAAPALAAALAAQVALAAECWGTEMPIRVRMALHAGSAEERDGDYFGPPLNRVARLMSAGHGGQTLLSLAVQELVCEALPPEVTLLDLGERRLKDLSRPERVFQLLHPALRADFPPLRSLDNPALPNNLPQQLSAFIGREAQAAEVKTLLDRSRLLTLTGTGGSGKTRLSLQVAADLLDQYFDGVWLVELAPLSDPALVPQAVADVLEVKEQPGQTISQSLTGALKERRLLLILDNCEHLISACAPFAADLLRHCPGVHLLTSSREPLNVPGEQVYRVPSLSLPDPKQVQTAAGVSQSEAVALFADRAQAVQPLFAVTDGNAPAVASVCARLDGIPLALELAAARVRSLSVEQVSTRLDQRFRLLTGGSRVALPRQQTLRALIDWSYDLLTDQEKTLLRRLSVFAGGWTLEAAEAVCTGEAVEDWEVLDLLTALVDKSLVVYEEAEGGESRYRLLETVRQYAAERLTELEEGEAARDKHLLWCVALAEEAEPHLKGPEQAKWLLRQEAEHDNMRAGLSWSGASSAGAVWGMRLAAALYQFWYVRGYWSEGRGHMTAALALAGTAAETEAQAKALISLGHLAIQQGDLEPAGSYLDQSLKISQKLGNQEIQAQVLNHLAILKCHLGDREAARLLWEQKLIVDQAIGNRLGEAGTLNNLGILKQYKCEWESARSLYEQVLSICLELKDRTGEAYSFYALGRLTYYQHQWDKSSSLFEQALIIFCDLGNRYGEAESLSGLGLTKRLQGDKEAARSFSEQSLAIFREIGSPNGEAECLTNLARIHCSQGELEVARSLFEHELALRRKAGDPDGEAGCLDHLGIVARRQGEAATAQMFLTQALTLKCQTGDSPGILDTLEEWAALAVETGNASGAVCLLGAAQAGREAIAVPLLPEQKETHEQTLAAAHAALGEEAFAAAWDAGRAMTTDAAVAYALEENTKGNTE